MPAVVYIASGFIGKAPKPVITALMRKLLTIAQAVPQYQHPFDLHLYENAMEK